MTGCELEAGCAAVATARIARARTAAGGIAHLTVIPASYGHGGIPACAEHVHSQIDGMLLTSLGPPQQPDRERLTDPPAAGQ